MRYIYTHTSTQASTGYFSCEPSPALALEDALAFLAAHPLDDFMRRHCLTRLLGMEASQAAASLTAARGAVKAAPGLDALEREIALLRNTSMEDAPAHLREHTSLVFLRSATRPDGALHKAWAGLFEANLRHHRALPRPEDAGLPPLYAHGAASPSGVFREDFPLSQPGIHAEHPSTGEPSRHDGPTEEETAALALERLSTAGIIAGQEMRHTASLSPIALQRPWNLSLSVVQGRHDFSLTGQATTYGRGLTLPRARVSCLMEMVERASAYLSVSRDHILGLARECPVRFCPRAELLREGKSAIDPNEFPVDVPYTDEPLCWMPGKDAGGEEIWVPVQMVSLFCNLDEVSLFESPGSTGLASGGTMEAAKLAALTEILERDAEATTPFHKSGCFTLTTQDPVIAALLQDYAARGIQVQFQDLTGPLGLPAYKCFVMSSRGAISQGYGAGLSSRRAVLAALTETPFPYPDGGPSGPLLRKLETRTLEELPDYDLGSPAQNLALLEHALGAGGRPPVYVDISRADLGFPVVRALVPGMELGADQGVCARVPFRLWEKYIRLFAP